MRTNNSTFLNSGGGISVEIHEYLNETLGKTPIKKLESWLNHESSSGRPHSWYAAHDPMIDKNGPLLEIATFTINLTRY